jgi:hypothetical protein
MTHTTSDGAKISIESARGTVIVTFNYLASNGTFNLTAPHAKVLANGAAELLKKYGGMLAMSPALAARQKDITAVVGMLVQVAASA